jgi:hypothetical protein
MDGGFRRHRRASDHQGPNAHNKTLYFIERGTERGMSADQGRLLEAELNKTFATGALKINVVSSRYREANRCLPYWRAAAMS